ncbi:Ribosomal RNA large subunit methyltransferase H [Alloiococcus otitis]|uniref:Ribosomal RNA large subunit methyltransferase H n=1 Tax=Alloiococcus otitis ATCC 51267 TaxID=883081 RepID=K9ED73_9LACT|nr:23S rRNA (pseudouridine(1915)-N(3))-methyltransferase RlmH [Alloiococcus otitis]EKU93791.1 rRNA large subunit m3Psi methyltransferase RlmH [Alloiococcus otitis ATCC 51267]SUU80219.1 Ribosomal RNA large subunit methyltransferase H [Alloiococcus otitis]
MQVKVIAVGKLKEKYLKKGIEEYAKRLGAYTKFEIVEVADEEAPENLSQAEMNQVKALEGDRILQKLSSQEVVFALDLNGKQMTSEDFAQTLEDKMTYGQSKLTFIIGGSLGLSQEVLDRAQHRLSFGPMTFPHQVMRLIIAEQVYRAFRIIRNEPYHK